MDRIEVSVAQLLAALETVGPPPPDLPPGALTVDEWSAALQLDERTARKRLQALHRAGRIEVHWTQRTGMDGRRYKAPAYRVRAA